jgi:hypothetical protein
METKDNSNKITSQSKLSIVSCIKGGIGNQLFQHVFGQSLAVKLDADLLYDISSFEGYTYHHHSFLNLIAPQAHTTEVAKLSGVGNYILHEGVLSSLSDQITLPNDAKVLVLDGYWQDEHLLLH